MDLSDFRYREERARLDEIFPRIDPRELHRNWRSWRFADPHETLLEVARGLTARACEDFIERFGFHQAQYCAYRGHCHQKTPILGAILLVSGFPEVVYCEARRVYPGTSKPVPPTAEPDVAMMDEFMSIGRIPYCALGVRIGGEMFYVSPKHIEGEPQGGTKALLTPMCYMRSEHGIFKHQEDPARSGMYLDAVRTAPFTWRKQKMPRRGEALPEPMEFFETFLAMTLVLE